MKITTTTKSESNERKRTDTAKKQSEEHGGTDQRTPGTNDKPKRHLDWDARDLKTYGWVPKSSRSTEGRYTNRFWEDE